MPVVDKSKDGLDVLTVKHEITVRLKVHHGHKVISTFNGLKFEPYKLIITWWPFEEKAKVQAYGPPTGAKSIPHTATFNLQGYVNYKNVPTWVAKIAREYGYQEPIEGMM